MEKQIKYVQVSADNAENCKVYESMMYEYIDEMNEHSGRPLPKEFQQKWINSIIAMQGPTDRHLELLCVEEMPIGFLYEKSSMKITRALKNPDTDTLWSSM